MDNFFDDFKPIRNAFRKLNLWDVLDELNKIRRTNNQYIPEIIEFIYLNSLIYSAEYKNIRLKNPDLEWQKLIKLSNEFQTKVNAFWINENAWGFLHKLYLNQLKTTSNHYHLHLYRYFYIFSNTELSEHFKTIIGISFEDFFTCAMWLHSVFDKKTYVIEKTYFLQKKYDNTSFCTTNILRTLDILSANLSGLRQTLKEQVKYDANTFITHDYEHIKKPIFESNQKLYCLFPENLLYQYTAGVYYIAEVYDRKHKLNNTFGASFEQYVGVVLKKNQTNDLKITKELSFNRNQNKTSDWIIEDKKSIIFIECKTKRLQIKYKKFDEIIESDINSIVDAVVQTYKVYNHYEKGDIDELKYDSNKFFFPIIITLEEWYAGFPDFQDDITIRIKNKLKDENLKEELVDNFKFHITSVSNFETDIQIMTKIGFKEFYERMASGKLNKEEFDCISFFSEEIENVILKPLKKQFQK